jgi:hypothetical protein
MTNVYKTVYQETLNYLSDKAGANFVADQLKDNATIAPVEAKTMNDLFSVFLDAAICTKRMQEAIGPVKPLQIAMCGFDPMRLYSRYGEKWELLAGNICDQNEVPKVKVSESTNQDPHWAYWETFCKTALSGACFLAQLETVKTFKAFVDGFKYNEMTTAVLPLLLQKEICGLTFPAACGFLNQAGFNDYIAPDARVKALLFDIEIIESKENYELLKTLIVIGRANNEKPNVVNKLFWMIAAGKLSGQESKNNNLRSKFIDHITPILTKSPQT